MKKIETYWFLMLAGVHVYFGVRLATLQRMHCPHHAGCLGPDATSWSLWPYFVAAIAAIGALASVTLADRRRVLQQFVFALLLASTVLMFITAVGYPPPYGDSNIWESVIQLWKR